jgi:hypothetical protein
MTKQLHVTFTADVTAADAEKGVIVGKVVPYGTFGNTSLGPVAFQAGAFGKVPETVKLLLEHDARRPIGRATSFVDGPDHMTGTFRAVAHHRRPRRPDRGSRRAPRRAVRRREHHRLRGHRERLRRHRG